jgi:elongation factor Ts
VKIDAKTVMQLRAETGAGMMDCKKALKENDGDVEKAKDWLRKRGQKIAEKKSTRETNAGQVASYIHAGGRIGVLVDLRCETDFVARTDDFQALARDLSMHIAATNPAAVDESGLDQDVVEKEKAIFREQVPAGKPEEVVNKIIEGKLGAYFKEHCLLHQGFVKDPKTTIKDLLIAASAKLGENIQVGQFVRFEIGG